MRSIILLFFVAARVSTQTITPFGPCSFCTVIRVSRVTVVEKIPRGVGYTEYKIKYDHDYEKWAQVYNHYHRPSIPMHESCGTQLEVGKRYLVGYNGQFYFVRDLDTITENEKKLLEFKI